MNCTQNCIVYLELLTMESTVLDTNVTALFSTNVYFDQQNCSKNSNSKGPRDNSIAILVGIGRLVEVYLPYTKVSMSTTIKGHGLSANYAFKFCNVA